MPRRRRQLTDPPDDLTLDEKKQLWRWAKAHGFSKHQTRFAIAFVLDWARSNDKQKRDWVATIRNGMRAAWALPPSGDGSRYRRAGVGSSELPQMQGKRRELATKENNNLVRLSEYLKG